MPRLLRLAGVALLGLGALALTWVILVWQWQDPFTALYTHWQQHRLAQSFDRERAGYRSAARHHGGIVSERRAVALDAQQLRLTARPGQAIGRITIGRIGLHIVLVEGTDHESLKKGPGRDARSWMPGQNRLIYIAGHRTTYLAPFSHIDAIRTGDVITLEMPYATFTYRAFMHRIVAANDMSVLTSPPHELLELQACHPRFFATHRYIVYARLVSVRPRDGRPYRTDISASGAPAPAG